MIFFIFSLIHFNKLIKMLNFMSNYFPITCLASAMSVAASAGIGVLHDDLRHRREDKRSQIMMRDAFAESLPIKS